MFFRSIIASLLTIIAIQSVAQGQGNRPQPFNLRAITTAPVTNDETIWWADATLPPKEQKRMELNTPNMNPGKTQLIKGSRSLLLFRSKDASKPFAKARVPAGLRSALMVVVADNENPLTADAKVVIKKGKDRNFDIGDYRFFNFSSSKLGVVYGQKRLTLKSGEDGVVVGNKNRDAKILMQIFYESRKNGKRVAKKIMHSKVAGGNAGQVLFFVWDGKEGQDLRYKPINMLPIEQAEEVE